MWTAFNQSFEQGYLHISAPTLLEQLETGTQHWERWLHLRLTPVPTRHSRGPHRGTI